MYMELIFRFRKGGGVMGGLSSPLILPTPQNLVTQQPAPYFTAKTGKKFKNCQELPET